MPAPPLADQVLAAWRAHDEINRRLLKKIPAEGFAAIPLPPATPSSGGARREPRGRTVAKQFVHMHNVRCGWLRFNGESSHAGLHPFRKGSDPGRADLRKAFAASGRAVERFLRRLLRDGGRVKMFRGNPVRWMAYLISHESHHRGSILLALKQNGVRLPDTVALNDVWYPWYFGEA